MPDVSSPPVSVDLQDPLPESNWLWRRILVFGAALIVSGLVWRIVELLGQRGATDGLVTIACWLLASMIVDRVFYLLAPSAEQFAKIVQTVSALRDGVRFHSQATVTTPAGTATTSTTASPPDATVPPWDRK